VINPVGVFGPALNNHLASSLQIVQRMMDGGMPICPWIYFGVVDVRDVADLHIRAMLNPAAKGERFIAVAANMSIPEIAKILKRRMGDSAKRVSTFAPPTWLLSLMARFKAEAKAVLPEVGRQRNASGDKAKKILAWAPRSGEDAIVATAESLVQLKLLKP
jgi:dihydroflavonol-4-reductase